MMNTKRIVITFFPVIFFLLAFENINDTSRLKSPGTMTTNVEKAIISNRFFLHDSGLINEYTKPKPHLILTRERLQYLRKQSLNDPLLKNLIEQCLKNANTKLSDPLPKYVSSNMVDQSWYCMDMITNLSFAYSWTGDIKYAQKVKEIMLTICKFPDWDQKHFIATGVLGTAVSFGFDWLYDFYDQDTRNLIIQSLVDKLLEPGITGYTNKVYWTASDNNWNVICNSSLIIGSLAIAEWHKEYGNIIIPKGIKSLDIALTKFSPDGSWFEGPGYQRLCLDYYSWVVSCLQTSTNNDLNLVKNYPYVASGGVNYAALEGRSKYFLCYSDIWGKYKRQAAPSLFFMGNISNNQDIISNEAQFVGQQGANVFHVLWYKEINTQLIQHTNKYFGGITPIYIFDDDKNGDNSIYLGIKGGENGSSHGHLDLGNFEFDALGVRWARDLGMDDYNLPGYFDYLNDNGQRYTYYRVSSLSHNVPIINNSNQKISQKATFINQSVRKDNPFCIIDLTNPYNNYVNKLQRGVKLIDGNKSIIVQDEYSMKTDQECSWGMTTDATITIKDPKTAKLTLEGKELYVKVLTSNCVLSIESATQSPPQNANTGVSRLIAKRTKDGSLNFSIVIQISPNWNGYMTNNDGIIKLSDWE